ncbi:hypothetical protein GQR58_002296 [Nymphon striatum]|nr:hypothetical protein GQR58_002296 [Nymphon striatum]
MAQHQQDKRQADHQHDCQNPQLSRMLAPDYINEFFQQVIRPGVRWLKCAHIAARTKPSCRRECRARVLEGFVPQNPVRNLRDPRNHQQRHRKRHLTGKQCATCDADAQEHDRCGDVMPAWHGFDLGVNHRRCEHGCDGQDRADSTNQSPMGFQKHRAKAIGRHGQQSRDRANTFARQPTRPPLFERL